MPQSDFSVDPAQWPATVGRHSFKPTRNAGPEITWGHWGNPYTAAISAAAGDLVFEILGPRVSYRDIGVIVRRGTGADTGHFALEFIKYPRGTERLHPLAVRLTFGSRRTICFSAGALVRTQPKGYTVLRRHNNVLVGRFGRIDSPHMGAKTTNARPGADARTP